MPSADGVVAAAAAGQERLRRLGEKPAAAAGREWLCGLGEGSAAATGQEQVRGMGEGLSAAAVGAVGAARDGVAETVLEQMPVTVCGGFELPPCLSYGDQCGGTGRPGGGTSS